MVKKDEINKANSISLELHTNLMDHFNDEHKIVGNSQNAHFKRLTKAFELGDFNGKSLLDVGCGLGAFYKLLKEKNINADYYGIDINPRLIKKCQDDFPEIINHFNNIDILSFDLNQKFDYVIAIGILNPVFGKNINIKMIRLLIQKLYQHSNIGFAISMTSKLSKKPNPETFYYNPVTIISIVKSLSNNFKLDHSYMPHDFTLFCYLNDFYSSDI